MAATRPPKMRGYRLIALLVSVLPHHELPAFNRTPSFVVTVFILKIPSLDLVTG
jgi:hypothetical protein